jgi:hypothetical protein
MLILSLPLTRKLSNFYMPPSSQSMEHEGWRLGRISNRTATNKKNTKKNTGSL